MSDRRLVVSPRQAFRHSLIGEVCRPVAFVACLSAFAGFRFPPEVIVVAVRWYLRYNLSYHDVDQVTVYRWVQRFSPLLARRGPVRPAFAG